MIAETPKRSSYKSIYKNGSPKLDLPIPIREHGELIGTKRVSTHISKLLDVIPYYSPFRNCADYYFDVAEANKFIEFVVNETVFPEGRCAGLPFIPETWQWGIFLNIFCWKHKKTNLRRYREVFIYIPRKNGKTSAFGVLCTLYMFFTDPEKRSQNFCCAADVEQASINFRHVAYNIEQNPRLLGRLINNRVNKSMKSFEHTDGAMFRVLSSIAHTKHGLSPNFVYADEIHAHKDSDLIDTMVTGTASRPQPLIVYTTTADYDRISICNDMYARAKKVATGTIEEPTFLPVIYEAEVTDDFRNLSVWRKANPNFGISIFPEHFERQISVCTSSPSQLNSFLRLHLNIRTKTETVWIPSWVWDNGKTEEDPQLEVPEIKQHLYNYRSWHNCAKEPMFLDNTNVYADMYLNDFRNYYTWYFRKLEQLRHSECWGGYDNSSSSDIASFVLFFPNERDILAWFWVPAESIDRRSTEEHIPYARWYRSGLINNTPMARISEVDIANALVGDDSGNQGICRYFSDIRNVSFDRWGSNFIYEMLYMQGIKAQAYPQTFAGMNEPCRKLETMITNKELFHGGNPVLDWMNNNTMAVTNNNNQMRVDKNKSTDKVDGMVALLMAIGGYIYTEGNTINSLPGLGSHV